MYNENENYDYGDDAYSGEYDPEYEAYVQEQIRLAKIRRMKADQLARDRLHAEMIMIGAAILILVVIVWLIVRAGNKNKQEASFSAADQPFAYNAGELPDENAVGEDGDDAEAEPNNTGGGQSEEYDGPYAGQAQGHNMVTQNGITYIDGIMIVNKTFSLPAEYDPGLDAEAEAAFYSMAGQAWGEGITLWICSGYRSYAEQDALFSGYAYERGLQEADSVSARPGHSEHQSGLCMDVNSTDFSFAYTNEALWLDQHCADYGFIIRFPQGKESITGYEYEPWHIRYVGVEAAQVMRATGQCLEEYLNVTSDYADSPENDNFIQKYS